MRKMAFALLVSFVICQGLAYAGQTKGTTKFNFGPKNVHIAPAPAPAPIK